MRSLCDGWASYWDIARYWLKIANLNLHTPPLFGTVFGVILLEFRWDLWRQKTNPQAILWRYLRHPTFSHCRLVTNTQTDGQTNDDSIYRTSIASCGKNAFEAYSWGHMFMMNRPEWRHGSSSPGQLGWRGGCWTIYPIIAATGTDGPVGVQLV